MERERMYGAAYNGSKDFTQHDVQAANATGFGAAADDYMERGIDLNEQLILNKPATFFFRMNGDAMMDDGIFNGDILIVDRSLKPVSGKVIVAIVDGELLVRRLQKNINSVVLAAANKKMSDIQLSYFDDRSNVWGVVSCVIHILEKSLLGNNSKDTYKHRDRHINKRMFY
ncbi:LexA family protein [Foetidibacter luteolus]|uniref:LexA family protein n=1 Tax=Foetidibacter luteolus TaxID=2608880 RepID=UPI00129AACDF|nr:translesion error-prone DNA polymerase V autoproteolytic subunit [Foetidibacter luteolus]